MSAGRKRQPVEDYSKKTRTIRYRVTEEEFQTLSMIAMHEAIEALKLLHGADLIGVQGPGSVAEWAREAALAMALAKLKKRGLESPADRRTRLAEEQELLEMAAAEERREATEKAEVRGKRR